MAALIGFAVFGLAAAAPYVPASDDVVLEQLPSRTTDAELRAVGERRRQLATRPTDAQLAADVAYRYYRLAQRRGDPRYIGYAQAVLTPWPFPQAAPADIRIQRALIAQFLHDFAAAEADLGAVLAAQPDHLEALSYRAVLRLVQGRFDAARADCAALAAADRSLIIDTCLPAVMSVAGAARPAYRLLTAALQRYPDASPSARLWVQLRLAEAARHVGDESLAGEHFQRALTMGIDDQYLLAAYADWLLAQDRAGEVIALLKEQTRNDVLLLRLLIAESAAGHPDAAAHRQLMADRIAAARRRGDELHLADEARFALRVEHAPAVALKLAQRNWDLQQNEPADAEILLQAALAAGQAQAAAPALAWMTRSGHETPALRALAEAVRKTTR